MHFYAFLLLIALVGVSLSKITDYHQRSCDPGWTQVGSKCYKLIGSQLASISSAAENEAIRSIAGGREIYTGGLSYALGPWSWADHTPFGVYRNWRNGYEPSPSPYKPCIKMNPSGQWFDNCCRVPLFPVSARGVCSIF
uniref:C-type lectin n=1 Tax=Pristionchus pacificus TaxID=54126 RepID=A0A2A6CQK4_PRIPA|eukprot:PDM80368.1 C-type lectin [Pristionchus pacificus]